MRKQAFTLAEIMLTMIVLSAIIFAMVKTLKPGDYRNNTIRTQREKLFAEIDTITGLVRMQCTENYKLTKIYDNCNKSSSTHTFGANNGAKEKAVYLGFMKGFDTGCTSRSNSTYLQLKNKACVYFSSNNIFIDANGPEGPNDTSVDQISITIGENGVTSDAP